jgi:hypothetical protein
VPLLGAGDPGLGTRGWGLGTGDSGLGIVVANVFTRQRPELWHQATASSSMVAKIVGSGARPNSARFSPSR